MTDDVMACFGGGCFTTVSAYYDSPEEEKLAQMRNKQITKALKNYHRQEVKKLKLLLLGEFQIIYYNYTISYGL